MSRIGDFLSKSFRILIGRQSKGAQEPAKFIGQDHLGNKYFEINKPLNTKRPVQRFFNRDLDPKVELVDYANVPPAWDAWLRFRRKDPPTTEEVLESEEYYKLQQEMAAKTKSEQAAKRKASLDPATQSELEKRVLRRAPGFTAPKVRE